VGALFDVDAALKHVFMLGPSFVMERATNGRAVREYLNVELASLLKRRVDVLARLEDDTVLHVEFQCRNDSRMGKRMAVYHAVLAERYGEVRSVVLYFGQPRLNMPRQMTTRQMAFAYELIDIRDFEAAEMLETGRDTDCVLALLAARRDSEFQRVLAHVEQLPEALRWRAWALLIVLSDLRELPRYVRLELERMDTRIRMRDDGLLMHFRKKWTAEGRVEGLREGKREGMLEGLRSGVRGVLEGKFGRIPGWASERIKAGNRVQLNRGSRKALTADSLERVLGPRGLLK
jgi:predicted transposase YdaD